MDRNKGVLMFFFFNCNNIVTITGWFMTFLAAVVFNKDKIMRKFFVRMIKIVRMNYILLHEVTLKIAVSECSVRLL